MEADEIEFLKRLIETPTPTGSESDGALLLGRWIKEKTGIQPTIDVHGNLHAVSDVGARRTVMLEGHGDEIGRMFGKNVFERVDKTKNGRSVFAARVDARRTYQGIISSIDEGISI